MSDTSISDTSITAKYVRYGHRNTFVRLPRRLRWYPIKDIPKYLRVNRLGDITSNLIYPLETRP